MSKLEIRNITLGYGYTPIVKDLCFHIDAGELLGLVGPNGCGKTSIIRALSRVLPIRSGSVALEGRNLTEFSRNELARLIGVVPQNPYLPDTFTVSEVVLCGRNPHLGLLRGETPRDMAIVWQAMESTGISHLAQRRIGELSGGEKQRVTIARVLAQEPEVVLLDEPTANLDISHQLEILNLITALSRKKAMAGLIAIHDLNIAAQYCSRVIVLKNGQVRAEGTPEQVITTGNIREVFGIESTVLPHPENNLPTVLVNGNHRQHN